MYDIPHDNERPASHMEYRIDHQDPEAIKKQAFAYMSELEGWCAEQKAGMLIDLVLKSKPEIIVEIGVWGGKSLIPMACALKANKKGTIFGIDPWSANASVDGVTNQSNKAWWESIDHEAIMWGLIDKIGKFNLIDQIQLIKGTSKDVDPIYEIDILHIDGNHTDEASYLDVTKWVPLVKQGGLIIVDDLTWSENGITSSQERSLQWLNAHCIKLAEFSDICVWGVWLKS